VSTGALLRFLLRTAASAGLFCTACEPSDVPQTTDSQTNWLKSCNVDSECGDYSCVCNVCTLPCSSDDGCADAPGSVCVAASDPGAIAVCGGGSAATFGMCLPRCNDSDCASGQMCVLGVCTSTPERRGTVNVSTGTRYQSLIGFGAAVAFGEADIVNHPESDALYRAAFSELGLDIIRLRNRYGRSGDDDLSISASIVEAAASAIGRTPTILLSSWSPPASLKANGAVTCGAGDTCTLRSTGSGFDYAGFGSHWRASIDAYAAAGIVPDYVGIQNNADWQPGSGTVSEACKFLPVEGTGTTIVRGVPVSIDYAGYAEALAATLEAFEGLPTPPAILAPEASDFENVSDYAGVVPSNSVAVLAHHLYGVDSTDIDATALSELGVLGASMGKPIIQTEMQANGFDTAVLVHHVLVVEGASAYVQAALTGPTGGPFGNPHALLGVTATDFSRLEPYYAIRHFALHTDPGWIRVDAASTQPNVLVSAWLSPDLDALTTVIVNQGMNEHAMELVVDETFATASVTRTVFDGSERFAAIGSLPREGIVVLPPRSVVTVAYTN
jgi:O-glycosyl hydrolase